MRNPVVQAPFGWRARVDSIMGARAWRAAAMLLLLAGTAEAQTPNVNLIPELKSKTPEEIEQDRITEKAYKDSLRKIPDAKVSSDPWGDVRSTDAPKAAPAKSKSRPSHSAN